MPFRGVRHTANINRGYARPRPLATDALVIGGTAALVGLSTAALLNNKSTTTPTSQPVVINNYYLSSDDDDTQK